MPAYRFDAHLDLQVHAVCLLLLLLLPGVTSMSVDTHKFGMAHKGTSVVLYRSPGEDCSSAAAFNVLSTVDS
jgi:glutamate/tyrosine decarboxylase-like PLP-dependent enzyme